MSNKGEKIKTWFWIIFITIPLITGFLNYEKSSNEFNDRKHEVIELQDVECGPEGLVSCEKVTTWKDIKSGRIFHDYQFKNHRLAEAMRISILSFLYGLIACFCHAWHSKNYGIKVRRTTRMPFPVNETCNPPLTRRIAKQQVLIHKAQLLL